MSAEDRRRLTLERTISRVRFVALAFGIVQTAVEPGDSALRSWVTLGLLALAALGGVALLRGSPGRGRVRTAGSLGMAADAAICVSAMFNNLTDPTDVVWVIVFLPLIGAALRWSLAGGLVAGLGFGAVTAAWSAAVADTVGAPLVVGQLSLRGGVIAVVGVFLGLLVAQLAEERRVLQQVLHLTRDLMVTVDRDGRVVAVNDASSRVLGHSSDAMIGRPLDEFMVRPERPDGSEPTGRASKGDGSGARARFMGEGSQLVERPFRRADGAVIWLELAVSPDDEHGLVYMAGRDVTDRREHARQLQHQAYHDPLTGVANRSRLMELLDEHLASRGQPLALLFVDLDRFKLVNDSLGHAGGDELLRAVVGRLLRCLRSRDTVARLAGDEFCVLIPGISGSDEAMEVAARIVSSLAKPYDIGGTEMVVSASVGVALSECLDTADTVLQHADKAMYQAKQLGRSQAVLHDSGNRAFGVEAGPSLRRALADGELCLHYQPIFDLNDGGVVSVEALVRWDHPDEGLLDPVAFLGAADDAGLSVALGEWVLEAAAGQLAEWGRLGLAPELELAVNLSAAELRRPETARAILDVLGRHGLAPHRLTVEVPEGAILDQPDEIRPTLAQLAGAGTTIAVDDFGTGYSSMRHLETIPATYLKIDRSFVSSMVPGSSDEAIVRSVVRLGRALGRPIVAAGVETSEQLQLLRGLGCARAQGFLLGPPVPTEEATALLTGLSTDRIEPAAPSATARPVTVAIPSGH